MNEKCDINLVSKCTVPSSRSKSKINIVIFFVDSAYLISLLKVIKMSIVLSYCLVNTQLIRYQVQCTIYIFIIVLQKCNKPS